MTLAQLKTQVLSRLEPLTSAPTYNAIHNDQYQRWADEKIPVLVTEFAKAGRLEPIEGLVVKDASVTLTAGNGPLPFDYFLPLSVSVTSALFPCVIVTHVDFDAWEDTYTGEEKTIHDNVLRTKNIDTSVTITSGIGTLPTDFYKETAIKVTSAKIQCAILDEAGFAGWDSSSFVTTPRSERPVAMVKNSKVYIKPTTLATPVYLDYIAKHPIALIANSSVYIKPTTSATPANLTYIKKHDALTGAQETLFNEEGDAMLIELVYQEALKALEIMEE